MLAGARLFTFRVGAAPGVVAEGSCFLERGVARAALELDYRCCARAKTPQAAVLLRAKARWISFTAKR